MSDVASPSAAGRLSEMTDDTCNCTVHVGKDFSNHFFQVEFNLLEDFQMQCSSGVGWLHLYWTFLVTRFAREIYLGSPHDL